MTFKGIKAVGFDLDGTFMRTRVDYEKLNNGDRLVLERHGIPFGEIDFGPSPKRPRYPIKEWLEAHGRGNEFPEIEKEIDAVFTECECEFVDEAEPFPGSVECLGILKERGYKVGLLTRGSLEYATKALGPLFKEFDYVMGRDHTCYDDAKPSPKAMIDFARELGVRPEEILYVGDNMTDWQSASEAGASFAGVLTGSGSREMWASCGDFPVLERAGDVVKILRRFIRPFKPMIRQTCCADAMMRPNHAKSASLSRSAKCIEFRVSKNARENGHGQASRLSHPEVI